MRRRAARAARAAALLAGGLLALLVAEALIAVLGGADSFEGPSPAPVSFGERGPRLTYVVLGDSTGAGQGAPYAEGIAVGTARHLAASRRVTLVNLAVSGADIGDVRDEQLDRAVALTPDAVLLAAGANDVTGLRTAGAVRDDLRAIAGELGCDVRVVLTGVPDMGSIPRLLQPLRAIAGWRGRRLDGAIADVARELGLVHAPIAARTGPRFREDPSLFAGDRFHPDARGYATWIPVLTDALDRALSRPRCPATG